MNKIYQTHVDVTPLNSANPVYNQTRPYADKYLDHQKNLIAQVSGVPEEQVSIAPDSLDINEGTDLIVTLSDGLQLCFAARVRAPGYFRLYGNEFTLRTKVISGRQTEYHKIMAGFGDLMLYGHADGDCPGKIKHWVVLDLDIFRSAAINGVKGKPRRNRDGSAFEAFDLDDFPKKMVVASNFYSWRAS